MTGLADVVKGLGNRLRTIEGLNVTDVPPASPTPPAAFVVPPVLDYRIAMRVGAIRMELDIVILSSSADHAAGQENLWPFLDWTGPRSVLAAVDADPTLGLPGEVDAHVMTARPLGLEEVGVYQMFGAALGVLVAFTNSP